MMTMFHTTWKTMNKRPSYIRTVDFEDKGNTSFYFEARRNKKTGYYDTYFVEKEEVWVIAGWQPELEKRLSRRWVDKTVTFESAMAYLQERENYFIDKKLNSIRDEFNSRIEKLKPTIIESSFGKRHDMATELISASKSMIRQSKKMVEDFEQQIAKKRKRRFNHHWSKVKRSF